MFYFFTVISQIRDCTRWLKGVFTPPLRIKLGESAHVRKKANGKKKTYFQNHLSAFYLSDAALSEAKLSENEERK